MLAGFLDRVSAPAAPSGGNDDLTVSEKLQSLSPCLLPEDILLDRVELLERAINALRGAKDHVDILDANSRPRLPENFRRSNRSAMHFGPFCNLSLW